MTGAIFKLAASTIVLVGPLSAAGTVRAEALPATTSESCDVAFTTLVDGSPEVIGTMAVPQFDPAVGTLQTVSVSGVVVLDYEATGIENLAGAARQFSASLDADVALTIDGAENQPFGHRSIRQAYTVALGGYDGVTDLIGTSGLNGSNPTFLNTGDDTTSVVYAAEPAITGASGSLAAFVGDHSVELGILADLELAVSPSTAVFVATNAMIAGELCVTYGFQPGPSTAPTPTPTSPSAGGSIEVISGPASVVTAPGSTSPLVLAVPSAPAGVALPETGSSVVAPVAASASGFVVVGVIAVRVARRPRRRHRRVA